MTSHPPSKVSKTREEHVEQHSHHTKLPIIPDLRFEYSYLRSIRPYIKIDSSKSHLSRPSSGSDDESSQEPGYVHVGQQSPDNPQMQDVVHIQWRRVAWITVRDQVISPLLQGALWALASYFLNPFFMRLGSQTGEFVRSHLPPKEGWGAGKLRDWGKKLGISSSGEKIIQRSW